MRTVLRLVLPFSIALLSACVTGGAAGTPRTGRSDVISTEEISASKDVVTAFDIVQRLRPQFLRGRGTSPTGGALTPVVYYDAMRLGTVDALRQIRAEQVKEIRFISATDATTRWGTNHESGVILVLSKQG